MGAAADSGGMILTKRGGALLFIVLLCLVMATVMSFAMTFVSAGFTSGFLAKWGRSFLIGFVVVLPAAMVAVPVLRRFTDSLSR